MSDEDTLTPTPARAGSGADLARRMDRMETRQDNMETALQSLSATVARVETNVQHQSELSKLRFDALDNGLNAFKTEFTTSTKRIEGILSGEIQTALGKQMLEQYQAFVTDSTKDRRTLNERVDALEERNLQRDAQQGGVVLALSGAKAIMLFAIAAAGPIVALIVAFTK